MKLLKINAISCHALHPSNADWINKNKYWDNFYIHSRSSADLSRPRSPNNMASHGKKVSASAKTALIFTRWRGIWCERNEHGGDNAALQLVVQYRIHGSFLFLFLGHSHRFLFVQITGEQRHKILPAQSIVQGALVHLMHLLGGQFIHGDRQICFQSVWKAQPSIKLNIHK